MLRGSLFDLSPTGVLGDCVCNYQAYRGHVLHVVEAIAQRWTYPARHRSLSVRLRRSCDSWGHSAACHSVLTMVRYSLIGSTVYAIRP